MNELRAAIRAPLEPEASAVFQWQSAHSQWGELALQVSYMLLRYREPDTGEVMSVDELAAGFECEPRTVIAILAELVRINALLDVSDEFGSRLVLSPRVGSYLPTAEARAAARDAAPPLLV